MATGFEIIGTFAALYQLINVSAGFISECKAVRDGERTAESDLKEHAQNLNEACKLTQARYQAMDSSEKLSDTERRVRKTASRCHASARALLGELDFVEKEQENYDCMGAVVYVIKSKVHRKKIERMEARFKNDQQELQIILQSEILHVRRSQNKAMQYLEMQEFQSLEKDIQILIYQVCEGFSGLKGFIEAQHKATNKVIKTRLDATDNLIVNGVAKLQQGIKEHFTSDSLFCIQGKPGSGKSTLIKFVIDNKNTQRLLKHQSPDIVIMSHFFWKIGSKEQSSIKGFLCSLAYQLLAYSEDLQDLAMSLYDTGSHKSYHDWSSRSLKTLLRQLLETKSHAICVFVDGLDEVANDDGLDKLTQEIEEVLQFLGIKICISSRPEASVVKWLEKLNTPSILLEDLTRPEMRSYVHKGLDPLLSSKKLSMETHRYLCDEMVRKSQGVFLWLSLVLRSLMEGIQNGDTEEILRKRLAELPSKIYDLYTDIWTRLNERSPVYRRDAVRYALYVLSKRWWAVYIHRLGSPKEEQFSVRQPLLGQIALTEMPNRHESLLKHGDRIDCKEFHEACGMAKKQIEIKCGGLLQIRKQEKGEGMPLGDLNDFSMHQVSFIHRTAHDFFTETEVGRSILRAYSAVRQLDIAACLVKGLLCLHRIIAHQHDVSADMAFVILQLGHLSDAHQNASVVAQTIEILPVLQSLYAENILSGNDLLYPKCHFLTYLVPHLSFHEFIKSEIEKASSTRLATQILQELCCEVRFFFEINRLDPIGLIGPLISMGADAHACIMDPREVQGREKHERQLAIRGTSFANFLKISITAYFVGSYKDGNVASMVSEVATNMAVTCPDLEDATLIVFRASNTGRITSEDDKSKYYREKKQASIFVEAKLSFLVAYLFSQLKPFIAESAISKGFSGKLEPPRPEIRFIFTQDEKLDSWICHRISSQKSCEKLIDLLFPQEGPPLQTDERIQKDSFEIRKKADQVFALLKDLDVVPCDFESEMLSMAADKLEVRNFQEAGVVPSFHGVKEVEEARGHSDSNIIHELVALATCKEGL
ncbi:hypothetical protein FMEXI_5434 [Fusarium mexicanum]|uniref:NACHT domain-containing protein n=1 Tax=Fusarium mexicanum TaxID=751941 RepID=A0A8H5J116_9HYPO|nr:hypothetical protein FMEXI_5434 [Fusarium mexicanum]